MGLYMGYGYLSHMYRHSSGFLQALEIMENLEYHQKSSMHGKIMEFQEKNPE